MTETPKQASAVDVAQIAAASKSFVGPAIACFFLYPLCFWPGFFANIAWTSQARRLERMSGMKPAGATFLSGMYLYGALCGLFWIPMQFFMLFGGALDQYMMDREAASRPQRISVNPEASELDRLLKKRARNEKDWEVLDLFLVLQPTLKADESSYGRRDNMLGLWVHNRTGKTISKVGFRWVYRMPGRELPYGSGEFSYEVAGGVEHDEKDKWILEPPKDLREIQLRPGAVLDLRVTRLYDAQGKLMAFDDWTEDERKRFEELQKTTSP